MCVCDLDVLFTNTGQFTRTHSAPEAAKQLLDNLLRADAPRLFPLFPFLCDGRRNEVTQIATHHSAPLQVGPIIVHLEQTGPVIVLVATTPIPL